ncbi:unnamed protein product [Urochloa decumbens]|uniref:DUF1618 domain-containing protein n=1 Tax=Urochloa decumbens TaxID=240449 RepID=A0ABC8Y3G7_9POAL
METCAVPCHAASQQPRVDWILLDKSAACIAHRPNGTTARGLTLAGQAIQVTFWVANPPSPSHLLVHFPGLNKADFTMVDAAIICSEKDAAILRIRFPSCPGINPADEGQIRYFVYTADHDRPLLRLLPVPHPLCYYGGNDDFGLLPCSADDGGEAGGFRIAALDRPTRRDQMGPGDYHLHVFSSRTWTWSTRLARLAPRGAEGGAALPLRHKAHRVIVLDGGTTLGFVDLWDGGILCCRVDVDDDSESPPPVLPLRHIRLPPPMHINRSMPEHHAPSIRDVVCVDGVIKFVEIANRRKLLLSEPSINDLSHKSVLYDWELDSKVANTTDPYMNLSDGWTTVTWNRQTNWDYWLRDCQVDVDDVTVSNPGHFDLLPQIFSYHSSGKLVLSKNIGMSAPTFVPQDGGVVYLMCHLEIMDKTACVLLAINTREKTLEDLSFSTQRYSYNLYPAYRPYALSKHMSMASSMCYANAL